MMEAEKLKQLDAQIVVAIKKGFDTCELKDCNAVFRLIHDAIELAEARASLEEAERWRMHLSFSVSDCECEEGKALNKHREADANWRFKRLERHRQHVAALEAAQGEGGKRD